MPNLDLTTRTAIQEDLLNYRKRPEITLQFLWQEFTKDVTRSNVAIIAHSLGDKKPTILLSNDCLKEQALVKTQCHIDIMMKEFQIYPCLEEIFQFVYQELIAHPYREFMLRYIIDHTIKYNIDISVGTARPCYYIHLLPNGNILIKARAKVTELKVIPLIQKEQKSTILSDLFINTLNFKLPTDQSNSDNRYGIDILLKPDSSFEVTQVAVPDINLYSLEGQKSAFQYNSFAEYIAFLERNYQQDDKSRLTETVSKQIKSVKQLIDMAQTFNLEAEIAEFEIIDHIITDFFQENTSTYNFSRFMGVLISPFLLIKDIINILGSIYNSVNYQEPASLVTFSYAPNLSKSTSYSTETMADTTQDKQTYDGFVLI